MPRRITRARTATTALVGAIALLCGTLIASPASALGAPTPAAEPSVPVAGSAAVPIEITLVTGDHVLVGAPVDGRPAVTLLPADRAGGKRSFSTRYDGDDVYVIPDDVAPLVPRVLDTALFDVTALARMGYDDRSRSSIPLIVQDAPGVRSLSAPVTGLQTRRALPSISGQAADLPKAQSAAFGAALSTLGAHPSGYTPAAVGAALGGVSHVWLDAAVNATDLDTNLTQISAPAAWDAGLSGAGVTVAVLDTGVDADHPDLAGQVTGAANFTSDPVATDDNGHGTHVASLVAGTGAAAAGARRGVAYGAHLLAGKVLGANGQGQISWVIAGMQWAVAQGANVVSMSLGGQAGSPSIDDPVVQALDDLTASSGALFVVAAGNSGSGRFTVQSPGVAPSALTVAAATANDSTAFFSSRGPTLGDFRLKPDIASPGVSIIGAKAGARTGNVYTTFSGTSQATPQVAGAAALLMQQHPDWSWQQVKATLIDTADLAAPASVYDQGGGRLNLARASTATLSASAPEVDFGLLRWPNRAVRTQQITLSNPGDSALTVDLTDNVAPIPSGPSTGLAAADATDPVALSASQLTVPAGGSAAFTVTLDPAAATVGALYGGTISVSFGGQPALHLPVGFEVEPERYDVAVTVLDRHGDPYAGGRVDLLNGDKINGGSYFGLTLNDQGKGTARVAPGWYGVQSRIETPAADGSVESVTFAGNPEVHVDADTSVQIDARDAEPLQAPTVSHVATEVDQAQVFYGRYDDQRGGYTEFDFPSADDIAAGRVLVQPTQPVQHGKFLLTTRWRLLPTGRPHGADVYDLVRQTPTVPDPPAYHVSDEDVRQLARLDVTYHALGTATTVPELRASWTSAIGLAVGAYRPLSLPSHRVELVTAAPDVHWQQQVLTPGPVGQKIYEPVTEYEPGQRKQENWLRTLHPEIVEAPRYPTTQWLLTGLGDGEHAGVFSTGMTSAWLQLRRDGTPIGERSDTFGYFPVEAGPGNFAAEQRLELDTTRLPAPASSHTTWAFSSTPTTDPAHQPATVPAIVRLDYQPQLDSLGYARANLPLLLGLRLTHLPGSTAPDGGFHNVKLWVSTDQGANWDSLHVVHVGGEEYLAVATAAKLHAGESVSLHASAEDAGGNAVDQVVQGIFQVR